ncbi:hypothetical protein RFI_39891 [Reticulomyxa filosa]|uniref:Uncharacterized protein n=1 Tax=Reticulomyxa filosa TaxID=46433 RepID=X6L7A7_RETFI|nr:hypothetical protein RFI_39891 [Reticulomyxa filosa]|eukprot:ETN97637.1 hypothetical protein RFI_39891 [Reticulomyxa filosa]
MEQVETVIINDIKCYAQDNISQNTIVRLHLACLAMSDLRKGQLKVSGFVSNTLVRTFLIHNQLNLINPKKTKKKKKKKLKRRFAEYRRIMAEYDAKYLSFIPLGWELPIQIASSYCSLSFGVCNRFKHLLQTFCCCCCCCLSTQLEEQLTRNPESCFAVTAAKEKMREFESEVITDAWKRLAMTEIDVRSWARGDPGDPHSWIKIDNKNKRLPGNGIGCVCIHVSTKKIIQQKTFYFQDKNHELEKDFIQFLGYAYTYIFFILFFEIGISVIISFPPFFFFFFLKKKD